MENKMTNDQTTKVYNFLDKKNTSKEKIEEAKKETDTTAYSELEKMNNVGLGLDNASEENNINTADILSEEQIKEELEKVNPDDKNYKEAFAAYDLSDDDVKVLLTVIKKYKDGEDKNLYNQVPDSVKVIADGLRSMDSKVSKNQATKFVLDLFINDAKSSKVIDDFNNEMNDMMVGMDKEYQDLFKNSMDEVFDKIDEIEKEDPEKAKTLRDIKNAFESAGSFEKLLEYLDGGMTSKKLKKLVNRYDDECFYFNKKVKDNVAGIKMPDIKELYPIIKKALPGFTELQIKEFIIILSKSSYNLDMNNLVDVAYIYRMISNINKFHFSTDFSTDNAKEIFNNVSKVIQKIINL